MGWRAIRFPRSAFALARGAFVAASVLFAAGEMSSAHVSLVRSETQLLAVTGTTATDTAAAAGHAATQSQLADLGGAVAPALAVDLAAAPSEPRRFIVVPRGAAVANSIAGLMAAAELDDVEGVFAGRNAAAIVASGMADVASGGATAVAATVRDDFDGVAGELVLAMENLAAVGEAEDVQPLWIAGVVAVTGDAALAAHLSARPDVAWILPDARWDLDAHGDAAMGEAQRAGLSLGLQATDVVPGPEEVTPTWSVKAVRAPEAWRRLGVDGSGVTIGIADSGVDYHHPLLSSRYRGYRHGAPPNNTANWWCRSCGTGALYPYDSAGPFGHGTHVAGVIAGQGGIGVAPGARWIAARACDDSDCSDSTVIAAMQWLLELGAEAPQIVNMSLTSRELSSAALMRPVVDAMAQAGILVVSTSGNGPGPIGAPGGLPSSLGIGATTEAGLMWRESRWGISVWGGAKPEVVAPGAGVDSARPGGSLVRLNGTSMAAPHVSGVAALVLSAAPGLTPAEVSRVITTTARGIGPRRPDGPSGWGIVDAYAAVRAVTDHGTVGGRVVRAPDDAPIPDAIVRVTDEHRDPIARLTVGEDGAFEVDLKPGRYVLFIEAFGYRTATLSDVIVAADGERLDLGTVRLEVETPRGTFSGRLVDGVSGAPVAGAVAIEGAPRAFETDELGFFAMQLPARTYGVRIAELGYRIVEDNVKVVAGQTVTRTYRLEPAPRILLVDGDAWYYGRAAEVIAASLARLRYVHQTHYVIDERIGAGGLGGPPSAAQLGAYDLVLWSSALSGPAYVRGAGALSTYLSAGGRLLLSGQDALCVDAGVATEQRACDDRSRPHPYVGNALHLRVVSDETTSRIVEGVDGGPLEGLTIPLNGPDSLNNQDAPDVIAVTNPLHTDLIARYADGGGAAALVSRCQPHRAVALGFGLEGIAGEGMRDDVLGRLIDALEAPTPERGVYVAPTTDGLIRAPGTTADFTVTLTNIGRLDTTFELMMEADGAAWPADLWSGGFVEPLSEPFTLGHCAGRAVGVRVTVPVDASRGAESTPRLRVLGADGAVDLTVPLEVRAPAPVLLVDGEYQPATGSSWASALLRVGIAHDFWSPRGSDARWAVGPVADGDHPPPEVLSLYPAVVWFVGYDFRDRGNLSASGQRALAGYLDSGGRLLLSSEDFLWARGHTPFNDNRLFHREYLGVSSFQNDGGAAHQGPLRGAPNSIFSAIEACRLEQRAPREDRSDRLVPSAAARAALTDIFDGIVAMQLAAREFRAVFLAFDAGRGQAKCTADILDAALDWFAPLAESTLRLVDDDHRTLTRRAFGEGERLHLELVVRASGGRAVRDAAINWQLPEGVTLMSATLPTDWTWAEETRSLRWQGTVEAGRPLRSTIEIEIDEGAGEAQTMTSVATLIGDGLPARRTVTWRVNAPDLADATKSVGGSGRVSYGDEVPYFINVRNQGTRAADPFIVTDTLPAGLTLVPDSWVITAGGGEISGDVQSGTVVWRGRIPPGGLAAMGYRARVSTHVGGLLRNVAVVSDGAGEVFRPSAVVFVEPRLLLPWLATEIDEDP